MKSKSSTITRRGDTRIYKRKEGLLFPPVHPGRTLGEELRARELSAHALALRIRVPAGRLTEIVNGRRGISAETALRLGMYFGTGPQFWMNLQANYDLAVLQRDHGARIAAEVQAA